MASKAAVYVHAIALLRERAAVVSRQLARAPLQEDLLAEAAAVSRSLRLFRVRLRRTEGLERVRTSKA